MDRKAVVGIIVLLILSISGIGYLNLKVLPSEIAYPVPPLPPPVIQPKDIPVDPDPYRKSKEVVKNVDKSSGPLVAVERNPFLWPDEKSADLSDKNISPPAPPEPEPDNSFNLAMILERENRKIALINDVFITEGGIVSGFTVEKIESQYVLLSRENETDMVWLPGLDKPLQHQGPSKKILRDRMLSRSYQAIPKRKSQEKNRDNKIDALVQEFMSQYQKPKEDISL